MKTPVETPVAWFRPEVLAADLTHPYPRYGLAVALHRFDILPDELLETDLRRLLIEAVEDGLLHFRMRPENEPVPGTELRFRQLPEPELRADASLVHSNGLGLKGVYLFPSIVAKESKGIKKATIKDTFDNAVGLLSQLKKGEKLEKLVELGRSFAPTSAKSNQGARANQTPPKASLLEAACALISTLTIYKPAAFVKVPLKNDERDKINTVIIPALPTLPALIRFIRLFGEMYRQGIRQNLMVAKLPAAPPATETPAGKSPRKKPIPEGGKTTDASVKSLYRRPKLHNGNYPYAPYDPGVFGPVGLLAAIGRWASEAEAQQQPAALAVLASLQDCPLYVISYDSIGQVRFGHHITRLAQQRENHLDRILAALYLNTSVYGVPDAGSGRYSSNTFALFCQMTSRFLQAFTPVAFADFLVFRAEYPAEVTPLFNEFFMNIPQEIVASAAAYGRWLNTTAYRVARADVAPGADYNPKNDKQQEDIKKTKSKLLIEFESTVMSAKTPAELLGRVAERCSRLLNDDIPAKATRFMHAALSGELAPDNEALNLKNVQYLLVAFMRLRSRKSDEVDAVAPTTEVEPETVTQPTE